MRIFLFILFFLGVIFANSQTTFNKRIYTGSTNGTINPDVISHLSYYNDTIILPSYSDLYGTNYCKLSFNRFTTDGEFIDSAEYVFDKNITDQKAVISSIQWSDSISIFFSVRANSNGEYQSYWLWLDNNLDTLKTIPLDPTNNSTFTHNITDVIKENDSLVCVGESTFNGTDLDFFIQRYDSAGNPGSITYFGGSGRDTPTNLIKTSDGGYLISGFTTSGSIDGRNDAFTYKLNTDFTLDWNYIWSNPNHDCPLTFKETSTGNFIGTTCQSYYNDILKNERFPVYILLSQSGGLITSKSYAFSGDSSASTNTIAIEQTFDQNYVILAQHQNPGFGVRGVLLKINPNGDSLFYREYWKLNNIFAHNYIRDVKVSPDGSYFMTGFLANSGGLDTGYQDIWFLKANCLGFAHNPVASATWGNLDNYTIRFKNESQFSGQTTIHFGDGNSTIQQEGDTSYILHTYAGTGPYQVMVVGEACGTYDTVYYSVNPTLLNTPENEEIKVSLYPNPTSNKLYLEHPDIGQYDFQIYNLSGQVFAIPQSQQNNQKLEFDVSQLPSGQYVAVGLNGERRLVERFSVMRN